MSRALPGIAPGLPAATTLITRGLPGEATSREKPEEIDAFTDLLVLPGPWRV